MKERPILFSALMVRAILEGRKTQTRRVIKTWEPRATSNKAVPTDLAYLPDFTTYRASCPYGQPGDRLWVREAFYNDKNVIRYRASDHISPFGWKPSIHMPRWASRIQLELTGVRVERLQNISEADAQAEGVAFDQGWEEEPGYGFLDYSKVDDEAYAFTDPRDSFRTLWSSINGAESWDANPWVWAVEFKAVKK